MGRGNGNTMLLWGAGLFGVGLLALGGTSRGRQAMSEVKQSIEEGLEWMDRIIKRTSAHEGTYDSLNLNSDNAGLSFGKLQWAQVAGGLGNLLAEMHLADPGRFAGTFGPSYPQLLAVTARPSLEPVEGAVLWHEPWISRFRAAGRDPVFQAIQDRLAYNGVYMRGAIDAAKTIGLTTERALSVTYDTSVQQGPGAARQFANIVHQTYAGRSVPAPELLEAYIQTAVRGYRLTSPPAVPHPAHPRLEWRQAGNEWHLFAGQFDLYTNMLGRRRGLSRDPNLSDAPVNLPGQATA